MSSRARDIMEDDLAENEPLLDKPQQDGCGSRVCCRRKRVLSPRTILFMPQNGVSLMPAVAYPANSVRNQKYSLLSFIPVFLYEQFRFFFNLYFLVVALTQLIPVLQVGFLFTYVAPLVFVLSLTMMKEGYDDWCRYRRDKEANSQIYERMTINGVEKIPSSSIRVGDLLYLHANQRVPADMVLLRTHDKTGSIFIRTDQLDGETDWKLRRSIHACQRYVNDEYLVNMHARLSAQEPKKEIYEFAGNFKELKEEDNDHDINDMTHAESLSLENTMWANTVIASGTVIGVVVYTGSETRAVMNANLPAQKVGQMDAELNTMSKMLFAITLLMAFILTALKGFVGYFYIYFFRFILLFSSIIPISLRVNLDMGKTLYSFLIMRDKAIPGTVVRNSTIPEELGRISYLFSDKTGTLTRNVMTFKVLQMAPPVRFDTSSLNSLRSYLRKAYDMTPSSRANSGERKSDANAPIDPYRSPSIDIGTPTQVTTGSIEDGVLVPRGVLQSSNSLVDVIRSESLDSSFAPHLEMEERIVSPGASPLDGVAAAQVQIQVRQAITALAICHNVTPVVDEGVRTYQAASPDEMALVKFADDVGLRLETRTQNSLTLTTPRGATESYDILHNFPFTSDTKRMGIVVRNTETGDISFYLKGAESVMKSFVGPSTWLDEEVSNLARVGLRTLVIAYRQLTHEEYHQFTDRYIAAKTTIKNRDVHVQAAVDTLEKDLQLLALTGVEDKLQEDVNHTLNLLRRANIRIWMLTGDKAETAICIGISARLIDKNQQVFSLLVKNKRDAGRQLDEFAAMHNTCLVIDGASLAIVLADFEKQFLELACQAPSVICCRCSPTQKAQMVKLMKGHTKKRTAAIGDGGNDVAMILAADVGIGVVGNEDKQASLAADFSINQFSYISRLLLWHGSNAYKRSARLSQFVIHRGLIISIIQAVFSAFFFFAAIPIYNGWLMVGYATAYTMLPVFSLVFDEEDDEATVMATPSLYHYLQKGRPLSWKTFFSWVWKSVYQGGAIMCFAILLFENNFVNIVAITFTSLILSELTNVALEVYKWHRLMIVAQLLSLVIYFASMFILRTYFDVTFLLTTSFAWKVGVITSVSCIPPALIRALWNHVLKQRLFCI